MLGNLMSVESVPSRTAQQLRLSLMPDFEMISGDQPFTVAPSAQRLIGFLAVQRRPLRRVYVSGILWHDVSDSRANASLRSAIWRSPSVEGSAVVCSSYTHVWLHPALQVDLDVAFRLAGDLLAATSLDASTLAIGEDLRALGGDVLLGWYDDWVIAERERYRQLRLHALDHLGELMLEKKYYAEAVQVGLVSVASEPLRESAQRLLVRAHLGEGNVVEAIRQYRIYKRMLELELQATPSRSFQELIARVVPRSSAHPGPAATPGKPVVKLCPDQS